MACISTLACDELARGEALDSDDVLGELPPYDLSSAHHHAVLRRRGQRYGAELLTLGFDTIELVVDRPPAEGRSPGRGP